MTIEVTLSFYSKQKKTSKSLRSTNLISSFVTDYDKHCPMSQLDTIFDHHTDAIINFLFDHFLLNVFADVNLLQKRRAQWYMFISSLTCGT